MRILVAHEDHGRLYYDASTDEQWARSALALLTRRDQEGHWYPAPQELFPEDGPILTEGQIEALPAEDLKAMARAHRKLQRARQHDREQYAAWWNRMRKVVDTQDKSLLGLGRDYTPIAHFLLEERSDHEYEYVEIVEVEQP